MTIDFSALRALFTDSKASGMYAVRLSSDTLAEIQSFAIQNNFKVFRVETEEVTNDEDLMRSISIAFGYGYEVWDGMLDWWAADDWYPYSELDESYQAKGFIVIFWGITKLFSRIAQATAVMLDVFQMITSSRVAKDAPMYILFVIEDGESVDSELQGRFNTFGVKAIGDGAL